MTRVAVVIDSLQTGGAQKLLAAFAEKWKRDPRPWAREQIIAYLELPFDRPGHQPVVKRLLDSNDRSTAARRTSRTDTGTQAGQPTE